MDIAIMVIYQNTVDNIQKDVYLENQLFRP